jgi:small subunit ribosomal protein S6
LPANVYEGMFILDANRFGRDAETVSGQIPTMIGKLGGEMLVSRLWEERRLAFPIKGQRKGAYWLTYFRLDSSRLGELRRQCRITDDILRMLFLKVDPRIVDTLVTHWKSAPAVARPAEEPKPAAAEPAVAAVAVKTVAVEAVDASETQEE